MKFCDKWRSREGTANVRTCAQRRGVGEAVSVGWGENASFFFGPGPWPWWEGGNVKWPFCTSMSLCDSDGNEGESDCWTTGSIYWSIFNMLLCYSALHC